MRGCLSATGGEFESSRTMGAPLIFENVTATALSWYKSILESRLVRSPQLNNWNLIACIFGVPKGVFNKRANIANINANSFHAHNFLSTSPTASHFVFVVLNRSLLYVSLELKEEYRKF